MTGGLSEFFYVSQFLEDEGYLNLWGFVKRAYDLKSLMGASIDSTSNEQEAEMENGLVQGHAVSELLICELIFMEAISYSTALRRWQ